MDEPTTLLQRSSAWAVHFYTATGAVLAFLAVEATMAGAFRTAFLWLALSTVVDATDGVLARLARVAQHTPRFDGARLDDIVDYLTYVFVPVLLLYRAGCLPDTGGMLVVAAVLLSSGYGFASLDAKSADHFFTGFPSYWNIVAVYLFAARLPDAVNAGILGILSVLVFVRIGYVYPSRTPILRGLTTALGAVWAALIAAIILAMPDVPAWLLIVSLYFPVYYTVLSLVLDSRRVAA